MSDRSMGMLALMFASALTTAPLAAQPVTATQPVGTPATSPADAAPLPADGPAYGISSFQLRYLTDNAGHPSLDDVALAPVTLTPTPQGWVAPRPGLPVETRALKDWNAATPQPFHASAVQRVLESVRDYFSNREYLGIYVAPDPTQIGDNGEDLRPADMTRLRVVVTLGVVTQVRSLAQGQRLDPQQRIDHPLHRYILEQSPVTRYDVEDADRRDLLRKDEIDRYVLFLSRHPGRRVDTAVAPSPEIGGVVLDYLITEVKPWLAYAQLSNTGTRNTDSLREQFGFRHYQLTNHDDILALDYSTAAFDAAHSVSASYEAPLTDNRRVRGRVFAGWSQYTASDVGAFSDTFKGESWQAGGELIANVHQRRDFFIDAVAGARYENIQVSDTLPGSTPGDASLLVPYVELRADRITDVSAFRASGRVECLAPGLTGVSADDMANLGRGPVDASMAVLHVDVSQSWFLEPLLNRRAWEDPTTPESSTLAHEVFFGVRGQTTFGHRAIPQYEMVAGGLYSVRGYPESVVAGDTAVIGTAEYRFHLPKALSLQPEPRQFLGDTFRVAPQQVYGPTDWDLILRTFVDAGWVQAYGPAGGSDRSDTLVGAGAGFEVQYRRHVTFRLDWGVALKEIDGQVNSGSNRVHFVLTLLY